MTTLPSTFLRRGRAALLASSLALSMPALALPMVEFSPGAAPNSFDFDVTTNHHITNPATGLFEDTYTFKLNANFAMTSTAIYFNGDIDNFIARLSGSGGLVATGTNTGSGGANPISYTNTIALDSLAAGLYTLTLTGNDRTGGDPFPYSLQVSVGPAVTRAPSNVPEPSSSVLAAMALLLLAQQGLRKRRQLGR
jgi:hypothetical protein